jgi:hypothetical protein
LNDTPLTYSVVGITTTISGGILSGSFIINVTSINSLLRIQNVNTTTITLYSNNTKPVSGHLIITKLA